MNDFSWHRRAQDSIAQAALTNSKRPQSFVFGVYPTHLTRGQGSRVWDTSGASYIDFICGLGSNILGYGHPLVNEAAISAMRSGLSLSLSSTLEVEFAEKIKELFPFIDLIRVLKTGTEACMASIRIARAFTGRSKVLSEGYHGHLDEFISLTPPALGTHPGSLVSKLERLDQIHEDIAAVIIEPVITDWSEPRIKWLKDLREACTKHGVVLIFDEVITGFRYLNHCVAREHGITPDLICLGKSIGNGMPISVVGGKKAIMNCGEYFVSSTFAGERASLAAGIETLRLLQTKYKISDLWPQGTRFQNEFNAIWPEMLRIEGYPTRGVFVGDELTRALFFQEACRAGLLFGPSFFFNHGHIEYIETVIHSCRDILARIKAGNVKLTGEMPQKPFAQKARE